MILASGANARDASDGMRRIAANKDDILPGSDQATRHRQAQAGTATGDDRGPTVHDGPLSWEVSAGYPPGLPEFLVDRYL